MSDENKAILTRFFDEGLSKRNADIVDALARPDFLTHFGGMPEPVRGVDAWKQMASAYFQAFPDMQFTLEDLIAEGDKVAVRWTWRATHKGEFQGVAATGKQVTVGGTGLYRITDGRMAEEWVNDDIFGLMMQLGALGSPRP